MAALLNDRNELLFSASSRVTGASVSISPGTATSLIIPKGATVPTPASITLSASVLGYITPAYVWSYRFGNTGSFTTIASTTNPTTITLDAAWLTAAGTNTVVQYKVAVSETTSNIGINQSEFTLPIPILREGLNGVDAINSAQVTLYRRTTTNVAPAVVTTGSATYTFSTGQVVGQPASWSQTIPAASGGAYLWSIQVPAAGVGTSYSFLNTLWSAPALYTQDGTSGANTALIYAYKRAATAPADNPGTVDYSFSTNTITTASLANSWLKTIPAGTDPLYVTVATASSVTATDNVLSTEWTTPVLLVQNGSSGSNGATVFLYARNNNSTTAPTITTTGSAIYTFSTGVLSGTIPTGWTQAIPAASAGSVIWAIQATAASTATTATIANTGWGTAIVLAQTGTRGSRQLYSNNAAYTSSYVYLTNAAGAASYAVKATDLIAAAVSGSIPTTPIQGDTVTFTNGSTYVYTITYNSSTALWELPGTVVDGSLLVTGSVTAAKINSNGLSIKDTSGNIILSAGSTLPTSSLALISVGTVPTIVATEQDGYANAYVWDFNNTGEGFTYSGLTTTINSTYIRLTSTSVDPIFDKTSLSFSGSQNPRIRVKIRRIAGTGWEGGIFYTTVGHGYSASYYKNVAAPAFVLNTWYVVDFDMSTLNAGGTDWTSNTITGVRFDFGTTASDIYEIDWIAIGRALIPITDSTNTVTGSGFRAGNINWDANGVRTSGAGVAITPGGILGHNGTNNTFSLNANTGDAMFGGVAQSNDGLFKIDFANKYISITV